MTAFQPSAATHQVGPIHHVTLACTDVRRSRDFYVGLLGLRLVKHTVADDDPEAHHLWFGDDLGRPGTLVSCFGVPGLPRGSTGSGVALYVALTVPTADELGRLEHSLRSAGVAIRRIGAASLRLEDPDGVHLALVVDSLATSRLTIDHVTIMTPTLERAGEWVEHTLGLAPFKRTNHDGDANTPLWSFGSGGRLQYCTRRLGPKPVGHLGPGAVHHVAFLVEDAAELAAWRRHLEANSTPTSEILPGPYFDSLFFRDPGGQIFELVTRGPGFTADEPAEMLGRRLCLPPQLEPRRAQLVARLPPL